MSEDVGGSTRTSAMVNESEFLFAAREKQVLEIQFVKRKKQGNVKMCQKHKNISDPMAAARMTPT